MFPEYSPTMYTIFLVHRCNSRLMFLFCCTHRLYEHSAIFRGSNTLRDQHSKRSRKETRKAANWETHSFKFITPAVGVVTSFFTFSTCACEIRVKRGRKRQRNFSFAKKKTFVLRKKLLSYEKTFVP